MAPVIPNYQLAAGNNNAGALAVWTAIADANSVPFVMPQGKGSRNRGVKRVRLNSTEASVGFNSFTLSFTAITLAQYALLIATYEGLVTVKIALSGTTFANFNAVLIVPDESELTYSRLISHPKWSGGWPGYRNVPIRLRKLEAL